MVESTDDNQILELGVFVIEDPVLERKALDDYVRLYICVLAVVVVQRVDFEEEEEVLLIGAWILGVFVDLHLNLLDL